MNPARGSEVRDVATAHAQDFVDNMDGTERLAINPPTVRGDVRAAYVAAFIAELMAAEGMTLERVRAAIDPEQVRS